SVDRRWRQPDGFGHRAQAPMGRVPRRRLQRQTDDLRDLVIADLARRAWTGLVQEALQTTLREAPPPLAHRVGRCAEARADVLVLHPFRRQQNHPRPLGQTLRRFSPRSQAPQFAPFAVRQIDHNRHLAHRRSSAPLVENRTYLPIRTLVQIVFGSNCDYYCEERSDEAIQESSGVLRPPVSPRPFGAPDDDSTQKQGALGVWSPPLTASLRWRTVLNPESYDFAGSWTEKRQPAFRQILLWAPLA